MNDGVECGTLYRTWQNINAIFEETMTQEKKRSAYSQKLLDPRWQKKRLEILNRDEWACRKCGDAESTLHVHHRMYQRGKEPWECDSHLLVTLCADCHEYETTHLQEFLDLLVETCRTQLFADDVFDLAASVNNLGFEGVVGLDLVARGRYEFTPVKAKEQGECQPSSGT